MRYFFEVAYNGTNYAGFQIQQNANTIQAEVERALQICLRRTLKLTGASRTDAGVHAYQNYFHSDLDFKLPSGVLYNLNSILPPDIAVKIIFPVSDDKHCRFNAISRQYSYCIYTSKNPFLTDRAWYYPYKVDFNLLQQSSSLILNYTDFTSFSKRNTQAYTNNCTILKSEWIIKEDRIVYKVKANRFLRGMVRGLVGTMLMVAREDISLLDFKNIIEAKDCTKANFSTPAKGLYLTAVEYPPSIKNT